MIDLPFLPATLLSQLIGSGEVNPVSLTQLFLQRVAGVGHRLNCYITLLPKEAQCQARAAAERAKAKRRLGPLDGIPIALKDNIDVAGVPTSNGFGGAPYRVPQADAEVVRRLRAAGAIILGKLNMHEGALGATNDNPHFGRCINPHREGYSPGGSSGGAGAAVAGGLCCAALGTDTGGSVRIPASYCGTVGLKPSYGLISTRGVVPLSNRLDHVGPLTRSVADAALVLDTLGGFDPDCPESRRGPAGGYSPPRPSRLEGLKLGILMNFAAEPQEEAITKAFRIAIGHFARLGAEIRSIELPSYDPVRGRRAGFLRVEAEAAFVHGPLYERQPERFSAEMRRFLDYGRKLLATQLVSADRRVEVAAFELTKCFEELDAIVSPTTPQAAPGFDEKAPENAGTFCIPANFAGCPAISVPMGCDELGRPLGLQVMGPVHRDSRVLHIAAAYEASAGLEFFPPPPLGPPPVRLF